MSRVDPHNPAPVALVRRDGVIVEANAAARGVFPALARAAEGVPLNQVIPAYRPDDAARALDDAPPSPVIAPAGGRFFRCMLKPLPGEDACLLYATDASDLVETRELLRLFMGVTASIGQEKLVDELMRIVGISLEVPVVLVGELEGDPPDRLRVVRLWRRDGGDLPEDAPTFPLGETPFHHLLEDSHAAHYMEAGVSAAWPAASALWPAPLESYLGVPLVGAFGRKLGLIAVFSATPGMDVRESESTLRIFARTLANELERSRAESRAQLVMRDYEQQLKELSCIWALSESIRVREGIDEICADLLELIPITWSRPDLAGARIVFDDIHVETAGFRETPWVLEEPIHVGNDERGAITVIYQRDPYSQEAEVPVFTTGEEKLLGTLARTLGEAAARREAEARTLEQTQSLAAERNRLATVLTSTSEGVVVTDAENRILLMNPAARRMLCAPEEDEPVGRDFLSLIRDDAFRTAWQNTLGAGAGLAKQELQLAGDPPQTLWATRSRIPAMPSGDEGYVTILNDVTRERMVDQMKSDFVSAVSHELRTPMTSIKGFVATLLSRPNLDEATRRHFLGIIDEEATRLTTLIEQLLMISRIEAGQIMMDRRPVDVVQIAERVLRSQQAELEKRRLTLERNIEPDLPLLVGDAEKIYVILINLVENAVKFSPEGGRVALGISSDEKDLIIAVEDSGIGIPVEEQEHVFERFYRVFRPGVEIAGTGLGLFIVDEMVTLHGGEVAVSSEVGAGSRFTVRLPLSSDTGTAQARGALGGAADE